MIERYRVQLNLFGLLKLVLLLGFGVGVVMGFAVAIFIIANGGSVSEAVTLMLISPFSNALCSVVVMAMGYPFYNWYCKRNRGQLLTGRFLKENADALSKDG